MGLFSAIGKAIGAVSGVLGIFGGKKKSAPPPAPAPPVIVNSAPVNKFQPLDSPVLEMMKELEARGSPTLDVLQTQADKTFQEILRKSL